MKPRNFKHRKLLRMQKAHQRLALNALAEASFKTAAAFRTMASEMTRLRDKIAAWGRPTMRPKERNSNERLDERNLHGHYPVPAVVVAKTLSKRQHCSTSSWRAPGWRKNLSTRRT